MNHIVKLTIFALLGDICLVYMFRGQFMSFIGMAIIAVYFGYTLPMLTFFGKINWKKVLTVEKKRV